MEIKYSVDKNNLYIYLFGELDEYSARRGKRAIDDLIDENSDVGNVIFNFSHLSFMDSTGIGLLIGRYKKIKQFNKRAYITGANVATEKVIQLAGLYNIMPKF